MKIKWRIIEKTIGVTQILWGLGILLFAFWGLTQLWEVFGRNSEFPSEKISLAKVFVKSHFSIVISVLSIFGGIALLWEKKAGWVASIIVNLTFFVSYFISLFYQKSPGASIAEMDTNTLFLTSLLNLIFISICGLLMAGYFRKKYNPDSKTWLFLILLTVVLAADRILI